MNKKTVAIIVGVVAVVAIIAVSIWGILSDAFSKTIYVTSVQFTNDGIQVTDDNSKIIVIGDGVTTVQLEWEVLPDKATDKTVTFQTSSTVSTVSEDGLVTLNGASSVQVAIKSNDGTNKTDTIQIMTEAPSSSTANVGFSGSEVVFETPATETNDLILNQLTSDGGQIVLFQGVEYTFTTDAEITLQNNTNTFYSPTESTLITTSSEDFQMTIAEGEQTRQINVKVVPYISLFEKGTSITDFETMTADLENNSDYLDTSEDVYLVGTANAFHFNTTITSGLLASLNYSTCELSYVITKVNNVAGTYSLPNYATVNEDGSLTFLEGIGNANIGKVLEMTVVPKYLNTGTTITPLTFRFQLNDGINIFNSNELKDAYANLAVGNINLHSTIVPTLSADQVNADGTAKNYLYTFNNNGGVGADVATGNVYTRVIKSDYTGEVEALTINGNYFTIDGSNLPLVSASEENGQAGSLSWTTTETPVSSVQVSIFHLNDNRINIGDDAAVVNCNNMTIIGNTTISPQYEEDEEDEEEVARLGSGYNGIINRGGNVTVENCIIMKNVLALFAAGNNSDFTTRYTYLTENWAGSYYGYCSASLSIYNSTFGQSGGASICFDDGSDTQGFSGEGYNDRMDPTLTFGPNVVFDNYVSGTEGWFIVNGTSTVVPMLKSQINGGISALDQTITKEIGNFEVFNFILMAKPCGSLADSADPNSGVQITVNFDMNTDGIPDEDSFQRASNSEAQGAIGVYSTETGFNKGLYIGAMLANEWLTTENVTAALTAIATENTSGLTTKQYCIYQACVTLGITGFPDSDQQTALMLALGSNTTVQSIIMQDSNVYGVIVECLTYYLVNGSFPAEYSSVAAIIGEAYTVNSSITDQDTLVHAIAAYSSDNGNVYNDIVTEGYTSIAYLNNVVSTVKADSGTLGQLTDFVTGIGLLESGAKYFEVKQSVTSFGSMYLIVEYFDIED